MSKSQILELSQKTLLKIMGKDAAPPFVKALQTATEAVLKKHLEVPRTFLQPTCCCHHDGDDAGGVRVVPGGSAEAAAAKHTL